MVLFFAQFAFMMSVFGLAAGLVALYYATKLRSKLVKTAGALLLVCGTFSTSCTGYYAVKYFLHGHYAHAYDDGVPMDDSGTKHYPGSDP